VDRLYKGAIPSNHIRLNGCFKVGKRSRMRSKKVNVHILLAVALACPVSAPAFSGYQNRAIGLAGARLKNEALTPRFFGPVPSPRIPF
jgi:hypothetical protein